MAAFAGSLELSEVRVFVARDTGRGSAAIPYYTALTRVALIAGGGFVFSGQRKRRLCMIEQHRREFRPVDRVAGRALRELSRVDVAVAGRAFGGQVLVHARRYRTAMTLFALQCGMQPSEEFREPGMRVPCDLERLRRVAFVACDAELFLVRIVMTG